MKFKSFVSSSRLYSYRVALARIDSPDLTRDQFDKITATFGRQKNYLNALCKRRHEARFSPQDKLYLDAVRARDAI